MTSRSVSLLLLGLMACAQNRAAILDAGPATGSGGFGGTGSGTGASGTGGRGTGANGAVGTGTGGVATGGTSTGGSSTGASGTGGRGGVAGSAVGGSGAPNTGSGGSTPGVDASVDADAGDAAGTGGAGGAGGGARANAIESIVVPAGGQAVASRTNLDNGELFLLKATGVVDTGAVQLDSEYGGFTTTGAGQDVVAGIDVGVDVGFTTERVPAGTTPGRKKWFGSYRADHTYYMTITGMGAPLSLKMVQPAGSAGTGAVTVSVIRLSPFPPTVTGVLDSVQVPVLNQIVRSTITTSTSVVYLLQAAGSGTVGGANLGLGDADWMDWDVNGVGRIDIGDNNVDYGLAVDESNPAQSPRLRWWGLWRKDHIYYMLFAGTGNPIAFTYYDSGYTDNSTTARLTVQIFPVP